MIQNVFFNQNEKTHVTPLPVLLHWLYQRATDIMFKASMLVYITATELTEAELICYLTYVVQW